MSENDRGEIRYDKTAENTNLGKIGANPISMAAKSNSYPLLDMC